MTNRNEEKAWISASEAMQSRVQMREAEGVPLGTRLAVCFGVVAFVVALAFAIVLGLRWAAAVFP